MDAESYFVRIRGRVTGPFTREQLIAQVRSGQITAVHAISSDQTQWLIAKCCEWLFPPAAVEPPPLPQASDPGAAASSEQSARFVESDHVADIPARHPSLPAAAHARIKGRARNSVLIGAFVGLIVIALSLAGFVYWKYAGSGLRFETDTGRSSGITLQGSGGRITTLSASDALSRTITSVAEERALAQAMGMVVCGAQMIDYGGKIWEEPMASGSAFAVTHDGFMLTNRHVIEEYSKLQRADLLKKDIRERHKMNVNERLWVFVDGRKMPAELTYASSRFDLAILKVDATFERVFRLRAADEAPLDAEVRAIGFPSVGDKVISLSNDEMVSKIGKEMVKYEDVAKRFERRDFDFVLTSGRISRSTRDAAAGVYWLQHNAALNPGNSGGPLITMDGMVVGINTLGFTAAAQSGTFYSLSMQQLRDEISRHVSGVIWAR